jgi:hypothetical protein
MRTYGDDYSYGCYNFSDGVGNGELHADLGTETLSLLLRADFFQGDLRRV